MRYEDNSPAVNAHLAMVQGIVQRMASSSASCKTWCITLVAAVLVVAAERRAPAYTAISLLPVLLFFFLDAYYLGLERCFRAAYDCFIDKLHAATIVPEDLYSLSPLGSASRATVDAIFSLSVWPFYVGLAVLVVLVRLAA